MPWYRWLRVCVSSVLLNARRPSSNQSFTSHCSFRRCRGFLNDHEILQFSLACSVKFADLHARSVASRFSATTHSGADWRSVHYHASVIISVNVYTAAHFAHSSRLCSLLLLSLLHGNCRKSRIVRLKCFRQCSRSSLALNKLTLASSVS